MFLKASKEVCNVARKMYYTENILTIIYVLISSIIVARQGEKSLSEYYSSLVDMFEELNMHQLLTLYIEQ